MTSRDRTILGVLAGVIVLAAFWFALLAPKRDDAKKLDDQVAAAQKHLDAATQQAAAARDAKATYARDYAAVARLGKAVPADADMPSLLFQLQNAADRTKVAFDSIELSPNASAAAAPTANATVAQQTAQLGKAQKGQSTAATTTPATTAPAPATQAAASTLPPGASIGAAGFPTMPFQFTFTGRYFHLEDFLRQLDDFARVKKGGDGVSVSGRLLTVDGFTLGSGTSGTTATPSTANPAGRMTASINATAYLLPTDQGLTNGATPTTPATGSSPTAPASGAASAKGSAPTTAATITGVGR